MKKNLFFAILFLGILYIFSSCEQENPGPGDENPFEPEKSWNGFIINEQEYPTPQEIIEIWGENLDSLSSDYDISFTDGTFDYMRRSITNYNVMVYFDANSPDLNKLSPGTYTIENTITRKPGNIIDAYIQLYMDGTTLRYPILGGEVTVEEQNGHYSIIYTLKTVVDKIETEVVGQYSGTYTIIDQTKL